MFNELHQFSKCRKMLRDTHGVKVDDFLPNAPMRLEFRRQCRSR